jgi:TPR repeat protein
MLGHLYHRGVGVSVNIVEAERLYRAAAARGDAVAHGGLGILMFERGLSRRERIPYIYQWLKLGSEGGHRDAQVYLDELVLRMTPAQVAEGDQLVEHYRNAWREQSAAADAQARRCTGCGTTHNVQSVQGVQ